jgi:hypothetical protein
MTGEAPDQSANPKSLRSAHNRTGAANLFVDSLEPLNISDRVLRLEPVLGSAAAYFVDECL